MNTLVKPALRISTIYATFSLCWILFSDRAVQALASDPQRVTELQTVKGWVFVIVTAFLLFVLVYRSHLRAQHVARVDGLTGLLTHPTFKQLLVGQISNKTKQQRISIVFIDIDRFKHINESLGFDKADEFLNDWANAVRDNCDKNCIVGRFSADQFVVSKVCDDEDSIEDFVEQLRLIFKLCQSPYNLSTTCSIGVAVYPGDAYDAPSLLAAGIHALQFAKEKGNRVFYHDKKLANESERRDRLFEDLKGAIKSKTLSLAYQPKYAIKDLSVQGVEILLRWNHPQQGFIPPSEFIDLAERKGICHQLTHYVVETAALELAGTGIMDIDGVDVAINVSAAEFNNREEMEKLLDFILKYPALAERAKIEITETATLFDMKKSADIIRNIRRAGLKFSIDDFGTGYTSLAMLKDFTIDEIKIDRSFVAELERRNNAKTIVSAIIGMAASFKINVIAEGVETVEQLNTLQSMGCLQAQGYLLGKPMAATELKSHLASGPQQFGITGKGAIAAALNNSGSA